MTHSLRICIDPRTIRRCARRIDLLASEISKSPTKIGERFFDLRDFPSKLIRFEVQHCRTPAAGEVRLALRLTDRYFDLLSAVRSGDIDFPVEAP